jgi:hypothetical protein
MLCFLSTKKVCGFKGPIKTLAKIITNIIQKKTALATLPTFFLKKNICHLPICLFINNIFLQKNPE